MTNYLRPDEQAAQSEIERATRRDSNIKGALKTGATIAAASMGIPAGGKLYSKIKPFLSSYIPADLAVKGISKISPNLGKFFKEGKSLGLDVKGGLDYLKENMFEQEQKQEKSPSEKNIIQKYSPNLHEYLTDLINTGLSPAEAATKARRFLDKKEQDTIKKIEKDYKADWLSIVESIFGSGETAQPSQDPMQPEQDPMQGMQPDQAQQAPTPSAGGGRGNAMLLQMLQEINQKIRG